MLNSREQEWGLIWVTPDRTTRITLKMSWLKKKDGKFCTEGTKAIPNLLRTLPSQTISRSGRSLWTTPEEGHGWVWIQPASWQVTLQQKFSKNWAIEQQLPHQNSPCLAPSKQILCSKNCANRRPNGATRNQHFCISLRTLRLQHHWWEGT